eukprot:UN02631
MMYFTLTNLRAVIAQCIGVIPCIGVFTSAPLAIKV